MANDFGSLGRIDVNGRRCCHLLTIDPEWPEEEGDCQFLPCLLELHVIGTYTVYTEPLLVPFDPDIVSRLVVEEFTAKQSRVRGNVRFIREQFQMG